MLIARTITASRKGLASDPPAVLLLFTVHLFLFIIKAFHSLYGFLFVLHFFNLWSVIKYALNLPIELIWIICLVGFGLGRRWAWWLAMFLDAVVLGGYIAGAAQNVLSGIMHPSLPVPALSSFGPAEILGFFGLLLLLTKENRQYYGVNKFLAGQQKTVDVFLSVADGFNNLIAQPPKAVIAADKFILGVVAIGQMMGAIAAFFLFFPYSLAIPSFLVYSISGIPIAIWLGSQNVAARLLSAGWWGFTAAVILINWSRNTNLVLSGLFLFTGAIALYLFFSAVLQIGYWAITRNQINTKENI